MRFLKVIFATLLAILGIIFILENRGEFEKTVKIIFDLYVFRLESADLPVWVLVLFVFFLGVFTASLYGIYEILKQRQMIRHLQQNIEILGEELKRAGVSVEAPATGSQAPPSESAA
uniref:LapA family protein n=1 Tax=Desulfobacca acetoxidans TaxID=60893 RepID=A0A7V4G6W0_9BACT